MKKFFGSLVLLAVIGGLIYLFMNKDKVEEWFSNETEQLVTQASVNSLIRIINDHVERQVMVYENEVDNPITTLDKVGASKVDYRGTHPECVNLTLVDNKIDSGIISYNNYIFKIEAGSALTPENKETSTLTCN